jgi:hypothetical protein
MTTSTADLRGGASLGASRGSLKTSARAYFASDSQRTAQTVLGLIWLLDGGLQFQPFMYSKGFIQMLTSMAAGQPGWLASSVDWGAHLAAHNLTVFNTLFALTQVAIGLGILYRPTLKAALALSFGWALVVWWFGEAFGMLFMNMAQPLTGAPGAVVLYALVGAMVWPGGRAGGVFTVRGMKTAWAVLWLLMAWLWLTAPSSSANAVTNAINAAPSGMSWLSSTQNGFASAAAGNGLVIAFVFAALSAAIGISVAGGWRVNEFLCLAVAVNLLYWVVGEGFGGIFQGGATDPNAAPLFLLIAYIVHSVLERQRPGVTFGKAPTRQEAFDVQV